MHSIPHYLKNPVYCEIAVGVLTGPIKTKLSTAIGSSLTIGPLYLRKDLKEVFNVCLPTSADDWCDAAAKPKESIFKGKQLTHLSSAVNMAFPLFLVGQSSGRLGMRTTAAAIVVLALPLLALSFWEFVFTKEKSDFEGWKRRFDLSQKIQFCTGIVFEAYPTTKISKITLLLKVLFHFNPISFDPTIFVYPVYQINLLWIAMKEKAGLLSIDEAGEARKSAQKKRDEAITEMQDIWQKFFPLKDDLRWVSSQLLRLDNKNSQISTQAEKDQLLQEIDELQHTELPKHMSKDNLPFWQDYFEKYYRLIESQSSSSSS